jgi:hypothetical protein
MVGAMSFERVGHPLQAFRVADEEIPARFEMVIELVDQPFLRRTIEIDHHIPAEDQIQRRLDGKTVVHQVHTAKLDDGGEVRLHLDEPGAVSASLEEMAFHDVGRHLAHTLLGVQPFRGMGEHACGDVRREDLKVPQGRILHGLVQRHGDGVRLLSGRAGGRPDANALLLFQRGENALAKKVEMFGFAEKVGLVRGQQIQHPREFFPALIPGDVLVVRGKILHLEIAQTFGEAGHHQGLLAVPQ